MQVAIVKIQGGAAKGHNRGEWEGMTPIFDRPPKLIVLDRGNKRAMECTPKLCYRLVGVGAASSD